MDANTIAVWLFIGALIALLALALAVFLLHVLVGLFSAFALAFLRLEKMYDSFQAWRLKKACT